MGWKHGNFSFFYIAHDPHVRETPMYTSSRLPCVKPSLPSVSRFGTKSSSCWSLLEDYASPTGLCSGVGCSSFARNGALLPTYAWSLVQTPRFLQSPSSSVSIFCTDIVDVISWRFRSYGIWLRYHDALRLRVTREDVNEKWDMENIVSRWARVLRDLVLNELCPCCKLTYLFSTSWIKLKLLVVCQVLNVLALNGD